MNAYQDMLDEITAGTNSFVVAILTLMYYFISAAGMTEAHMQDIMTRLKYTYTVSTSTFNDGTKDYTINDLFTYAISTLYPSEKALNYAFLKCSIRKCKTLGYVTADQKTALEALLSA
jgi:hypothetical protein